MVINLPISANATIIFIISQENKTKQNRITLDSSLFMLSKCNLSVSSKNLQFSNVVFRLATLPSPRRLLGI